MGFIGYAAAREEIAAKEKDLEEKVGEVKTLQREKAELERMRHTDTVKLRLEVSKLYQSHTITQTVHNSMMPRC